jgi:hypothetical protein
VRRSMNPRRHHPTPLQLARNDRRIRHLLCHPMCHPSGPSGHSPARGQ